MFRSEVSFAEPADDPPEGVMVDVTEAPFGHPVTEVVAPSPQHSVDAAQQVGESSVFVSGGERSDLGRD